MTQLTHFNTQPAPEAVPALLACCGSQAWAQAIAAARPYPSVEALIQHSSQTWFALPEPAWLQAFAAHPRIGERQPDTTTFLTHSTAEQSTTQQTLAEVATQLLEANQIYEATFGFRYIVFASGRTAPELLQILHQRLKNTRPQELHEAALQQDRITQLRLKRWLQP